jgi:hypothetical protein
LRLLKEVLRVAIEQHREAVDIIGSDMPGRDLVVDIVASVFDQLPNSLYVISGEVLANILQKRVEELRTNSTNAERECPEHGDVMYLSKDYRQKWACSDPNCAYEEDMLWGDAFPINIGEMK